MVPELLLMLLLLLLLAQLSVFLLPNLVLSLVVMEDFRHFSWTCLSFPLRDELLVVQLFLVAAVAPLTTLPLTDESSKGANDTGAVVLPDRVNCLSLVVRMKGDPPPPASSSLT